MAAAEHLLGGATVTAYTVRVALRIDGDADEVDAFTTALADVLLPADDGGDVGGSLATGAFDVWVSTEAASEAEAAVSGTAAVRAAARTAAVRGWPGSEAWPEWLRQTDVEVRATGYRRPSAFSAR